MNVGEEICGEWLRHVGGCEFVQYNLKTTDVQGEIDVIGLNMKDHTVYACEVAIHLTTGLQYTRDNRPDNVPRLAAKLRKDLQYLRGAFPEHRHVLMLWSPVVRNQRDGSKHNQMDDVRQVASAIETEFGIGVELIINGAFRAALDELRRLARKTTKELDSSVMRYLQVEEHLATHLARERG